MTGGRSNEPLSDSADFFLGSNKTFRPRTFDFERLGFQARDLVLSMLIVACSVGIELTCGVQYVLLHAPHLCRKAHGKLKRSSSGSSSWRRHEAD